MEVTSSVGNPESSCPVHKRSPKSPGLVSIDYESSCLIFIRMKKRMPLLELFCVFTNLSNISGNFSVCGGLGLYLEWPGGS